MKSNNRLEVTFEPSLTFTAAKADAASNVPELRRYTAPKK